MRILWQIFERSPSFFWPFFMRFPLNLRLAFGYFRWNLWELSKHTPGSLCGFKACCGRLQRGALSDPRTKSIISEILVLKRKRLLSPEKLPYSILDTKQAIQSDSYEYQRIGGFHYSKQKRSHSWTEKCWTEKISGKWSNFRTLCGIKKKTISLHAISHFSWKFSYNFAVYIVLPH